jgi:hypothetical protein
MIDGSSSSSAACAARTLIRDADGTNVAIGAGHIR